MQTIKRGQSPVIFKYLKQYQEDPTSRVFAPLAEAYRRSGMIDEAIEIAREGLEFHPGFVGGKVALARALFDRNQYEEVLDLLRPVVHEVPDNLVAQKLTAESSLMLGLTAEALNAYKMLLYFNPNDAEVARSVFELEAQAYEKGTLVLRKDREPEFDIRPVREAIDGDPVALRKQWIGKVEFLQGLLQKVERYRRHVSD